MENETTKAEVVIEKATEITEQPVINEKLIEELSAELDNLQTELDNKKYIVEGGRDMAAALLMYVKDEVKWKFTEALGVIEVAKILEAFIKQTKQKELMLGPLEIEAIYYFFSKHESAGLAQANKFYGLLKAINPAKARKEADMKKFEEINFRLNSVRHGVDPEDVRKRLDDGGEETQQENANVN
jgi:hypothetical protein